MFRNLANTEIMVAEAIPAVAGIMPAAVVEPWFIAPEAVGRVSGVSRTQ